MIRDQPIAISGVLEPVSLDAFFEEYWEKKPLHIARQNNNPFDSLIAIDTIEELLSTNTLHYPTIQLSRAGELIPVSNYTNDNELIVSNRVIEHYKAGSTIVISQAQRLVSNLMTLCRSIQAGLMMNCQTNVYLSPAGNQGFNPHYDTHDVFILQVRGKKTFNFYSSGASLPTSDDRFDSNIHNIGEKTEEIVLSAGDTLYIPRGIVHDAVADSHEPSLHITLGVYPVLLHNLVSEITQVALESDERLRSAISQSTWRCEQSADEITQLIKDVLQEHLRVDVVDVALQRLRDDVALSGTQDSRGLLTSAKRIIFSADTELRIDHSKLLEFERIQNTVVLRLYGQVLEFAGPLGSAVEWILQRNSVRPADIPELNLDQKMALIEQLIGVNVLKF